MVPRVLFITGILVVGAWPATTLGQQPPHAFPGPHNGPPWRGADDGLRELRHLIAWTEIAIPDLRLQTPAAILEGPDSLVVSWPVHVWSDANTRQRFTRGASFFFEPQVTTANGDLRWLAGMSGLLAYKGLGGVVEGGWLGASDGAGAFVSAGPVFGDHNALFVLLARRYWVTGEDHYDLTFEMRLPTYPLMELLAD